MKHQNKIHDKPTREVQTPHKPFAQLKAGEQVHQRTEVALIKNEEKFRDLLEHASDGIVIVDKLGRINLLNAKVEAMFGYSREELIGKSVEILLPPRFRNIHVSHRANYVKNPEIRTMSADHKLVVLHKDGSEFPVKIGLSFMKSKDDMLIVSYITDMTNCKHAEAPSQVSAGKYLNLFEQSKDPISITTRDGKIIEVNKAFLDLFGYTKEEINRMNAKELYHNPESRKRFQEEIEKQGSVKDFEVELCKKDGQKLIVLLTSTVRRDSEANILGYQGILRDITERKRAEEALRESEARNLAIVNTAADGIITTDDHGRIESFNPAAEKMFGYATNEVIGQNVNILMASPYREEHDSYIKNYLESGEKKVIGIAGREVVAKCKDGTSFPVLLAVSEMSFSNKRMFTGIIRDITERKRAEEVLRNIAEGVSAATGKAFFCSLVQYLATNLNMDYAFIGEIAGEKGDSVNTLAVYAHGEIVENFQYHLRHTPCENVIAKRLSAYTHSVQQQFPQDDLLKELGVESYIGTPLFDSEGYPLGIMAVLDSQALSNTTLTESMLRIFAVRASAELERKRVEEALLESEKRYKRLLASVTDYLYTVKVENGQEVETSHGPGCEALTGYTPQEYAANPDLWYQMVHKDDRAAVANQARKVLSEKDVQPIEHRIIHKNGSIRWVKNTPVPRFDNHGNLVAYDGLVSDITERRFLQEELARAQRLETAGRVAGQIAHDFNNLLSPLTAYPALIKEELPQPHHVFDMLDEMEDSAQKIAEINQQLLALGRRGHYTLEPVDLNDLVHKVVMSISLPEEIVIQEKLASDLFLIKGGTAQLTRAFINLISNAKEAMHGKGSLTVSTENSYLEKPLKGYRTVRRGEYVKLQISDTGIGIKAELLDKIFDPFFTTKKMDRIRGSGLGLSVVHGIIEDHQGYILVDSKRKKGTTFSLFFPVTRDIDKELAQAIEKSKGGNERILVVDDDPVQRKVAGQLLKRLGYKVRVVSSGESAVTHLKKHPYDLLIIDMVMDGIDGVETYRRILKIEPEQKAIILSGYAMSHKVQEALKLGAGSFVTKPVTQKILANAVRRELDRKSKTKKRLNIV